jgi:hypothetical protein
MIADREFWSAERRTEPSGKQSAIPSDKGATPVVLQDMSSVEGAGTEWNEPKPSKMIQQPMSLIEATNMNMVEVTGTKLKTSRQCGMVETREKGLVFERLKFESPSF